MATLTLRNVPDALVGRLKARAKRHRRSLNNETIAALELADATATGATPLPAAVSVDLDAILRRMEEIRAGLRSKAAAEGKEILTVVVDTNVLIELFLPTQNGDVVQRLWDADRDWRLPQLSPTATAAPATTLNSCF